MHLLIAVMVVGAAVGRGGCQLFGEAMPRAGNVRIGTGGGVSYGAFVPDFTTPAPLPPPTPSAAPAAPAPDTYQWRYAPDDNSIVEATFYVEDDTPRAAGRYEVVHPDNRVRSQVIYVADDNGYRANYMLWRA